MFAIGNDELEKCENIKEGDFAPCPKCGILVKIKNSEPYSTLQFVSHCDSSWLVGINNKFVGNVK